MFTPPPSPRPPLCALKNPHEQLLSCSQPRATLEDPEQQKKALGRQTKRTILLVPLVLIAITASTRYFTHPAVFDLFTSGFSSTMDVTKLHKRHDLRRRDDAWTSETSSGLAPTSSSGAGNNDGGSSGTVTSATSSTTPSTTPSVTSQPLPTIPSSPPTLPTPFPQPFSAGIPTDNMSIACLNFFNAMANSIAFRECRPFSLLLQSSDQFITSVQAQSNLTLSNTLVWGTCNVTPGKEHCAQTMASYADQLRNSCPNELQSNAQPIASDTLIALQAYGLMYDAGCSLVDPTSNTYCFIEAAQNSNPSDLYFYQLPIGLTYPTNASPTCSTCSKDLLALYWNALGDSTQSANLRTLATTYNSGAQAVDAKCNSDFAVMSAATSVVYEVPWSMALEHFLLPLVLGLWLTRTLL